MSGSVVIAIPVLLAGGTEFQTLTLAKALVAEGYEVSVCCYHEYEHDMVKSFEAAGAQVILMKYERTQGLVYLAKGLIRLFKRLRPDIVHVQYIAPGFVPIVAARLAGVKTIFATVHQPATPYGWKAKLLFRTAARFCSAFFCVSKTVEESWFGSSCLFDPEGIDWKRGHWTIYNAVDMDRIAAIAGQADAAALRKAFGTRDRRVIGCFGRLRWEKGQATLLEAFAEVNRKYSDTLLLLVGDGPDREQLEEQAVKLGIAQNVIMPGNLPQEKVYELYGIMNVVAVPSIFEGFGLAAVEAMAAGLPVVASAVGGLTELVKEGVTGHLVSGQDAHSFASALVKRLNDEQLSGAMGVNGRLRAKELFSLERFHRSICTAYAFFLTEAEHRL